MLDLEAAAQEFRYARNLITAEEMEAWLVRCGLSFEDWTAYLERHFPPSGRRRRLGPWPAADGFRLAVVVAKTHASESDPEVRRRAEKEVVATLVSEAMKHVRWHERFWSDATPGLPERQRAASGTPMS